MKIKKFCALLFILTFTIGFVGCAKNKAKVNYKESALVQGKEFLFEKYGLEFEIEGLERKDSGAVRTKEYIGTAYPVNSPDEKFTIWVDPKEKTTVDSYPCAEINKIANSWISTIANDIWPDSQVEFQTLLVSQPSKDLTMYNEDNIEDYFTDEFSGNKIRIHIAHFSDKEVEKIHEFLERTDIIINGLLYVDYSELDYGELVINLASDKDDIEKRMSDWSGK